MQLLLRSCKERNNAIMYTWDYLCQYIFASRKEGVEYSALIGWLSSTCWYSRNQHWTSLSVLAGVNTTSKLWSQQFHIHILSCAAWVKSEKKEWVRMSWIYKTWKQQCKQQLRSCDVRQWISRWILQLWWWWEWEFWWQHGYANDWMPPLPLKHIRHYWTFYNLHAYPILTWNRSSELRMQQCLHQHQWKDSSKSIIN